MGGLPRVQDTSRSRDVFAIMVLGGVERLTEDLRRGYPFDEQSLIEMRLLRQRLSAFDAALAARETTLTE
ncbi:hypothetical protein [Falsirhodobacter halotolerans]|uniref:hypothetical protein n=1 Tax=Falsirhodobacter halotolerans TaxID=1146892 RepID=UPI001FD114A2|nr:hypothetical protein [Falsirhodobacter halotolerans]MCJ8138571.1 hypothetical protein [Falsirhodobacter halotolerans]